MLGEAKQASKYHFSGDPRLPGRLSRAGLETGGLDFDAH